MGVVRTDKWLDQYFYQPERICENLKKFFEPLPATEIYQILLKKGMYKPNTLSKNIFLQMTKTKIWERFTLFERKYKRKWTGPDIPIFIFPGRTQILTRRGKKNGFTFPDKMFLFINDPEALKDLEALFVHEYHHATRMAMQKKSIEQYTLLDSLFMEGLAEQTVREIVGEDYVEPILKSYDPKLLVRYWEKYYKNQLNIKITDPRHDAFLYGTAFGKPKLGYAIGYFLVEKFREQKPFSIEQSLQMPAEQYLNVAK